MSEIYRLSQVYERNPRAWSYRTDFLLIHVLRTQGVAARRNITPVPFWRFNKERSDLREVINEAPYTHRIYDAPVAAFIFIKHSPPSKNQKGLEEDSVEHTPTIDLAECIRLGEIYDTNDVALNFKFYLPQPDDIYQWNGSLYEISGMTAGDYYQPLSRHVTWNGKAALARVDVTDPETPIKVLNELPEVQHPLWLR